MSTNGVNGYAADSGGNMARNGTRASTRLGFKQGASSVNGTGDAGSRDHVVEFTPEMLEEKQAALLSQKQAQLERLVDRHDNLVRELFHMENFTMMLPFDPKEAKLDNTTIFREYKSKYDLFEKAAPAVAGPSRQTRGRIQERKQIIATSALSSTASSSPIKPKKLPKTPKTASFYDNSAFQNSVGKGKGKVKGKVNVKDQKDAEENQVEQLAACNDDVEMDGLEDTSTQPLYENSSSLAVRRKFDRNVRSFAAKTSGVSTTAPVPESEDSISTFQRPHKILRKSRILDMQLQPSTTTNIDRENFVKSNSVFGVKDLNGYPSQAPLEGSISVDSKRRSGRLRDSLTTDANATASKVKPRQLPALPSSSADISPTKHNVKRIKLIVRRPPPAYTHPKQKPPRPKFNSSLEAFLSSYINIYDQDVTQSDLDIESTKEAKIREKVKLFRDEGRFIPGTDVLFGSDYQDIDISYVPPPKRSTKDIWDDIVEAVVARGRSRPKKPLGKQITFQIASKIQTYFDGQESKKIKAKEAEERRLRNLAKSTMKLVIAEWKKAVYHIREKERQEHEEEERRLGHAHLDAILDQSGQLLETQQGDLSRGDIFGSRSRSVSSVGDFGDEDDEDQEEDDEERDADEQDENDDADKEEEEEQEEELEQQSEPVEEPYNDGPFEDIDQVEGQNEETFENQGAGSEMEEERMEKSNDAEVLSTTNDLDGGDDEDRESSVSLGDDPPPAYLYPPLGTRVPTPTLIENTDQEEVDIDFTTGQLPIGEEDDRDVDMISNAPSDVDLRSLAIPDPESSPIRRQGSLEFEPSYQDNFELPRRSPSPSVYSEYDSGSANEDEQLSPLTKTNMLVAYDSDAYEVSLGGSEEAQEYPPLQTSGFEQMQNQVDTESSGQEQTPFEVEVPGSPDIEHVDDDRPESPHEFDHSPSQAGLPHSEFEDQPMSSHLDEEEQVEEPDEEQVVESEREEERDASEVGDEEKAEENVEVEIPEYLKPYAVTPVEWDPESKVTPPLLLRGVLRPYQQSGLEWLASLHVNRLNGILADEMGLGKTIQTIALLAHLACDRGIWGPHLIVVPTSVLLNWEMEFKKFLPGFRVLSYHGSTKRRKELRHGWNDKHRFNVCITSYTLASRDAHIFKRKAWYYLILDEAHMIKNFKSQRWNILLMFRSYRRLLLTGTPLQNNLTELWALLQFLMSGANFANLKEFGDWFSNPLEKAIEMGSILDDEMMQRVSKLHTVLRPYLLRRLKRDVEKELPSKFEHLTLCHLSKRQRFLYDEFMSRAQTRDALESGIYQKIANILMQLRKVCNHPDLFEVRPIVTSFSMPRSAIADYEIKELLVRRRFLAEEDETVNLDVVGLHFIEWQNVSLLTAVQTRHLDATNHLPYFSQTPEEPPPKDFRTIAGYRKYAAYIQRASIVARLSHIGYLNKLRCSRMPILSEECISVVERMTTTIIPFSSLDTRFNALTNVDRVNKAVKSYSTRGQEMSDIVDRFAFVTPAVVVLDMPQIALSPYQDVILKQPLDFDKILHRATVKLQIAFPDPSLLQYDCGKLQRLAELLREKKAGGHRILIFTQMTRILDILETFLNFHGYLYLRLDGATKIEDRQYITERFNADSRVFCFIASSRSGGVGINLTGADTVIFYDSDFNPQMDRQCEDRAHRIGQIRDVHIYRFVSQFTVEEAMLRKANQKRSLDDLVIQKGEFDWRSLFNDEGALTNALGDFEDADDRRAAVIAAREEFSLVGADEADFGGDGDTGASVPGTLTPADLGAVPGLDEDVDIDAAGGDEGVVDDGDEDQEEVSSVVDYMLAFVEMDYDYFRDWRL